MPSLWPSTPLWFWSWSLSKSETTSVSPLLYSYLQKSKWTTHNTCIHIDTHYHTRCTSNWQKHRWNLAQLSLNPPLPPDGSKNEFWLHNPLLNCYKNADSNPCLHLLNKLGPLLSWVYILSNSLTLILAISYMSHLGLGSWPDAVADPALLWMACEEVVTDPLWFWITMHPPWKCTPCMDLVTDPPIWGLHALHRHCNLSLYALQTLWQILPGLEGLAQMSPSRRIPTVPVIHLQSDLEPYLRLIKRHWNHADFLDCQLS